MRRPDSCVGMQRSSTGDLLRPMAEARAIGPRWAENSPSTSSPSPPPRRVSGLRAAAPSSNAMPKGSRWRTFATPPTGGWPVWGGLQRPFGPLRLSAVSLGDGPLVLRVGSRLRRAIRPWRTHEGVTRIEVNGSRSRRLAVRCVLRTARPRVVPKEEEWYGRRRGWLNEVEDGGASEH
jgi:hypothetical protein